MLNLGVSFEFRINLQLGLLVSVLNQPLDHEIAILILCQPNNPDVLDVAGLLLKQEIYETFLEFFV